MLLQALSHFGRCKTFDDTADGYGRGEGFIAMAFAHELRHTSCCTIGIIKGTATNQDGRSSGLTAPNGPAQSMLIRKALAIEGLSPCNVLLTSVHGTGAPRHSYRMLCSTFNM